MIKKKNDSLLKMRLDESQAELDARDYRVMKSVRTGTSLEKLYPGENEWYEGQVEKINALKADIAAKSAVPDAEE
jgi:hypothetical protein